MAVFAEYDDLDALGLAALVREGEITPAELLAAACQPLQQQHAAHGTQPLIC